MIPSRGIARYGALRRALVVEDIWRSNAICLRQYRRHLSDKASKTRAKDENESAGSDWKTARWRAESVSYQPDYYPRAEGSTEATLSLKEVKKQFNFLGSNEAQPDMTVHIRGRIHAIRGSSSSLLFYSLEENNSNLQVIFEKNTSWLSEEAFKKLAKSKVRRGDIISVHGYPERTSSGELSIRAKRLKIISPTLNVLPKDDESLESSPRHVQFLKDKRAQQTIRLRSLILTKIRNFFLNRDFVEVQTPILSPSAGGAAAKPFETVHGRLDRLSLRIAPELWLKRLVVGGMDRIFELGQSFRNEGVDNTHNPEFTTCEFYEAHATIEDLINTTEALISELFAAAASARATSLKHLPQCQLDEAALKRPWKRIDFINGIQEAAGIKLPNLKNSRAPREVFEMMKELRIEGFEKDREFFGEYRSLPWLLDKLASVYLEPQCIAPTFITNIPVCLSPLSKSSRREEDSQVVSHRAELFIQGMEVCNAYEEENSPFEQRRKFRDQAHWNLEKDRYPESKKLEESEVERLIVRMTDQSYISALEWGLPPTGGWGMGVDRICMLLGGSTRIGEVLAFGGIDNVRREGLWASKALKIKANDTEFRLITEQRAKHGKATTDTPAASQRKTHSNN